MRKLLTVALVVAGVLVDKTGQYLHVFFACSVVIASAATFIMVSFYVLDRRDWKSSVPDRPAALPEAGRTGVDVAPSCQYSSVPTDGDKVKVSVNGAEYVTSV